MHSVLFWGVVLLVIFVTVQTCSPASFNDPLWKTADSAQLIRVQKKETPWPVG